jgi:predicted TIM-barrel fold metal-dependent hydrolase
VEDRRERRRGRLCLGRERYARGAVRVCGRAPPAPDLAGGVLGLARAEHARSGHGLLPWLLYERLDELGIDFSVLYPTVGLRVPHISDDVQRRAACRAFNVVTAEYFRDFADRMTPAAVIPVHTPDEAIEELEYCTRQLGFKVAMFGSLVPRRAGGQDGAITWYDPLGLDSAYDYDALWAACAELCEDGLITADDFRDFTFANAVRLWGTANPAFFSGTVVEKAAAQVLGAA